MIYGYPEDSEEVSEEWSRLYQVAENKLVAFMGYIAQGHSNTMFIVYSRGTGGGWVDEKYRANWVKQAQGRFPALTDKITTVPVPGGVSAGSFRTPKEPRR